MNNFLNASLNTVATGLVALGFTTIAASEAHLLAGAIEILLGLGVYIVYEVFPTK